MDGAAHLRRPAPLAQNPVAGRARLPLLQLEVGSISSHNHLADGQKLALLAELLPQRRCLVLPVAADAARHRMLPRLPRGKRSSLRSWGDCAWKACWLRRAFLVSGSRMWLSTRKLPCLQRKFGVETTVELIHYQTIRDTCSMLRWQLAPPTPRVKEIRTQGLSMRLSPQPNSQ